jgi:hypothetical protein
VELSRVHLTPKAGVDGSDYINASFLQVCTVNFHSRHNEVVLVVLMFFFFRSRFVNNHVHYNA